MYLATYVGANSNQCWLVDDSYFKTDYLFPSFLLQSYYLFITSYNSRPLEVQYTSYNMSAWDFPDMYKYLSLGLQPLGVMPICDRLCENSPC